MATSEKRDPKELGGTFFTIPRYVVHLPDMTFLKLLVFECIFQFWNSKNKAWLSNKNIMERTGITDKGNLNRILFYLEKQNLIYRKTIEGRRFFIQPENKIESDCEEIDSSHPGLPSSHVGLLGSHPRLPEVVTQDYLSSHVGLHNIKEEDKERREQQPVVVFLSNCKTTHDEMLAVYRGYPFETDKIRCEEDFIEACSFMLRDRGNISAAGRLKAIRGFVMRGEFCDPEGWNKRVISSDPYLSLSDDDRELVLDYKRHNEFPHLPNRQWTEELLERGAELFKNLVGGMVLKPNTKSLQIAHSKTTAITQPLPNKNREAALSAILGLKDIIKRPPPVFYGKDGRKMERLEEDKRVIDGGSISLNQYREEYNDQNS